MKDIVYIFILNFFFILGSKEETNDNILNNINANINEAIISKDHFEKVTNFKTFSIQRNSNKDSVNIYTNNPYFVKLNGNKMYNEQELVKLDSPQNLEVSGSPSNPVIIYILYSKNGKIEINEHQEFTFYAILKSHFQKIKFLVNLNLIEEIEIIIQSNNNSGYNNISTYVESSEGRISSNSKIIKIDPYQFSINIELGIKIDGVDFDYDQYIFKLRKSNKSYKGLYIAAQVLFYIGVLIFCVIIFIYCCGES